MNVEAQFPTSTRRNSSITGSIRSFSGAYQELPPPEDDNDGAPLYATPTPKNKDRRITPNGVHNLGSAPSTTRSAPPTVSSSNKTPTDGDSDYESLQKGQKPRSQKGKKPRPIPRFDNIPVIGTSSEDDNPKSIGTQTPRPKRNALTQTPSMDSRKNQPNTPKSAKMKPKRKPKVPSDPDYINVPESGQSPDEDYEKLQPALNDNNVGDWLMNNVLPSQPSGDTTLPMRDQPDNTTGDESGSDPENQSGTDPESDPEIKDGPSDEHVPEEYPRSLTGSRPGTPRGWTPEKDGPQGDDSHSSPGSRMSSPERDVSDADPDYTNLQRPESFQGSDIGYGPESDPGSLRSSPEREGPWDKPGSDPSDGSHPGSPEPAEEPIVPVVVKPSSLAPPSISIEPDPEETSPVEEKPKEAPNKPRKTLKGLMVVEEDDANWSGDKSPSAKGRRRYSILDFGDEAIKQTHITKAPPRNKTPLGTRKDQSGASSTEEELEQPAKQDKDWPPPPPPIANMAPPPPPPLPADISNKPAAAAAAKEEKEPQEAKEEKPKKRRIWPTNVELELKKRLSERSASSTSLSSGGGEDVPL